MNRGKFGISEERSDRVNKLHMTNHVKGILYIIAAAVGFSFMTFFVKLSGDLPTMQKVFFRNAVALTIAVFTVIKSGEKFYIEKRNRMDILMRCVFGTSGVIANFYAIDKLDLSDANMLNKLSPFFAIILSIPILKEKPSKTDITATIIAFIGALFIIRPTGTNLQLIPALSGGTLWRLRCRYGICIRKKAGQEGRAYSNYSNVLLTVFMSCGTSVVDI